ncbi:MAG: DNA adenine methylase [Rickettsiales bacterium]|jgi:adenine-specific DNA-methyltransferase|nr:DNA adenine methylase [Rickettsiales bacterium]
MAYNLQNRRYIGNKFRLLPFIDSVIEREKIIFDSFADVFAGTAAVAEHFMAQGKKAVINDNLYSNFIFYKAWLSNLDYNGSKMADLIRYYNESTDFIKNNYFSDTFSDTYFSYADAKKIGSIREHIESIKNELLEREYAILLSSLLYTTDKIANTVGHFEAFLGKRPDIRGVKLEELNIKKYRYTPKIYQMDANKLIKNIKADVLYLDPPYNARQYVNFYHLLENIAEWEKPVVSGKTLKMPRDEKKSQYSQANAKNALKDIVGNAKAKYILLSYNNTYLANSGASINKITEEDIVSILESVGKVKKFDTDYRFFNSGKTNFDNHKEMLYLCKVA